jgi:long-subunit acyl-CoA synthetase (AMP-forming)
LALAGLLEEFYETCGIPICIGYSLTECSLLVTFRMSNANLVVMASGAGKPCTNTELHVANPNAKAEVSLEWRALPDDTAGVMIVCGPQGKGCGQVWVV